MTNEKIIYRNTAGKKITAEYDGTNVILTAPGDKGGKYMELLKMSRERWINRITKTLAAGALLEYEVTP